MNHSEKFNKTWATLDEAGKADLKARAQAIRTPEGLEEFRARFKAGLAKLDEGLTQAHEDTTALQTKVDTFKTEVDSYTQEISELSSQVDTLIFAMVNSLAEQVGDLLAQGEETAADTATSQLLKLRSLLPHDMRQQLEIKDVQDIWMTLIRMHRELIAKGYVTQAASHKREMEEYRASLSDTARASLTGLANNPLSRYKVPLTKLPAPPVQASK